MKALQTKTVEVLDTRPKAPLRFISTSGSPYERGYQYGEQLSSVIGRFVDYLVVSYNKLLGRSRDQLLHEARKYSPFIESYSPEIYEEIKGISEGSGRTLDEIVMAIAYYEISESRSGGCTGFASTGRATADGYPVIGQTWDDCIEYWWDGDISVLLSMTPKSGPNILAYTYPAIPAAAGTNSAGITICWNSIHNEESQLGVPTYVIVRDILMQRSIGDALGSVIRAKRAESFNFMLSDENGELYDVEATPSDMDIMYSDDVLVHANHFVSKKLKVKDDKILAVLPDTVVRHNRMQKLLKHNYGSINLEKGFEMLRDHVNYPWSICKHADKNRRIIFDFTYASWVIMPSRRELWITHGIPCESEYQKYIVT